MAAVRWQPKLAMSGDLPKIQAFLLADIVGSRELRIKRETPPTKGLTDLVWTTRRRIWAIRSLRERYGRRSRTITSPSQADVRTVDVIDLEEDTLLAHHTRHHRQNQLQEPGDRRPHDLGIETGTSEKVDARAG